MKSHQYAALFLAMISGAALADGVALFSPGPTVAASDVAAFRRARPQVTQVQGVVVNKAAINSTVINVSIAGQDFRFVGAPVEAKGSKSWAGSDGAAQLLLYESPDSPLSGQIYFSNRYFEFKNVRNKDVILEVVDTRDFSPEAVALRKKETKK